MGEFTSLNDLNSYLRSNNKTQGQEWDEAVAKLVNGAQLYMESCYSYALNEGGGMIPDQAYCKIFKFIIYVLLTIPKLFLTAPSSQF